MAPKKVKNGGARKREPAGTGLPQGFAGTELDARRAGRLQTVDTLKTGRTPLQVIEVAAGAVALAEGTLQKVMKGFPPPPLACQEGCDWCCHLTVGVTAAELVRILDHLRRTLSPDELQATRERVVSLDDQRRELKSSRRSEDGLPCALLVNHRCIAYPVRPLTCRGFNSTDAHRCKLFLKLGSRVSVPAYAPQMRLNTFVLDGVSAGLAESGLKGDRLELTAALRIAFEVPDAVERWLAGEAVFAPARLD